MAQYQDDDTFVPFEIGLQAGETLLMWGLGGLFWLLSLIFMGLAVGFSNLTAYGISAFILGGLFMISSQLVTPYDPMKTMRFPITGLITWLWVVVLAFPIMLRGFSQYIGGGTGVLIFIVLYIVLSLLATAGMIVTFYLTSFKILKWMNTDLPTFLYVMAIITTVIGIADIGNSALLKIDEYTFWTWMWLFLFGMSYILFLELNHGAHSFNEIVQYAKKQSVGDFSLTPVINNYYIMGFILMVIIGGATLVVLLINWFIRWVMPFFSPQMAESLMGNSVYSVVFTLATIFIPLSIVLILFFEYKNRKEEEEEEALKRRAKKGQVGA
ncbi:MAG: hypothetical protein ACMUIG_08465 [Thermoplasmatota archaeon]